MTDPRIEAATKAIREAMTKHGSAPDAEMLARVALAAADAAAWRPIETSPQDTTILTYYADGRVMPDQFPYRGMLEWQEQFDAPPTHWQPLPAPPTGGGNG